MVDGQASSRQTQRIAIFANDSRVFPEDLTSLIERLSSYQNRVRCYAPGWPDHVAKLTTASGAETDTFPIEINENWALMPHRALRAKLSEAVNSWQPDVVIAIGLVTADRILPNVDASRSRRVAILDHFISSGTTLEAIDEAHLLTDEKAARLFKHADHIVCHTHKNTSELKLRIDEVGRRSGSVEITTAPGMGVNTSRIHEQPMPALDSGVAFLMTAPLDPWKGVMDYAAAANLVSDNHPDAIFRLQGAPGRTDDAIPMDQLTRQGRIVPIAPNISMAQAIAEAHVVVVPAHHEGIPREVMLALAIGRPLICADFSGSREAIDERNNGIIFDAENPNMLARACESLLRRPDLLTSMGHASRLKAERRFVEAGALHAHGLAIGVSISSA
ncbi:MAG: glycosyltransferase [Pseudomonadota bacterium]